MNKPAVLFRPDPLKLSQTLQAPRALVFKAWSHADHVRRWFAPSPCTAEEVEIDFRPGGVFNLTMRIPDGSEHQMRMHFTVLEPPARIGFAGIVQTGGKVGFRCDTLVVLSEAGAGTKVDVTQSYEIYDEAFRSAVRGALEGWNATLNQLEREARGLAEAPPRSAVQGAFTLRRAFAASPARLYKAFADPEAKKRWFAGPTGFVELERVMDIRVGGRERVVGRHASGMVSAFDAIYFDVIPDERLIYSYEMRLDGRKISVSLAALALRPIPRALCSR